MMGIICDSLHHYPNIVNFCDILGSVGNVVHTITVAVVSAIK